MPPRKIKQSDRFRCDQVEGERFHAQTDDVFRFNWWEVFCFPYILCSRVWDCCVSLCSGTNQCLVYWMMIQWVVCKITKITTPDPIIFPYYFYLFCQVILLTAFFAILWYNFGHSILLPYFKTILEQLKDEPPPPAPANKTAKRLSLRKYCFRKGEIFENSFQKNAASASMYPSSVEIVMIVIESFINRQLFE